MSDLSNKKLTRRAVLKATGAAGVTLAFPSIVPSSVFGKNAPSNRITIGMVGMGRQAMYANTDPFLYSEDCQVVAVCDVDKWRLDNGKKKEQARDRVVQLRKENYSVLDIHWLLCKEGTDVSTAWIWTILREEGFAKLPRRKDEERPSFPRPEQAEYADVRHLCLDPREIDTRVGGIFLLIKILVNPAVGRSR